MSQFSQGGKKKSSSVLVALCFELDFFFTPHTAVALMLHGVCKEHETGVGSSLQARQS